MNLSAKILDTNELLGESFSDVNDGMYAIHSKNEKLASSRSSAKEINTDLRAKVTKMQDMYMDQAQIRLELQRNLARILDRVQDRCRDGNLVEDIIVLALQCESDAKSEMVALEIATGEPGLAGSDVSDTEGSMTAFGESWSS